MSGTGNKLTTATIYVAGAASLVATLLSLVYDSAEATSF